MCVYRTYVDSIIKIDLENMMTKDAYMALYEKYVAGQCTADEIRLLETYRDAFELTDTPWDEAAMGNQAQVRHRIRKRLFHQITSRRIRWYNYAAAAVLLIGITVFIGLNIRQELANSTLAMQESIQPGSNKALLTLEDGTQVELDQADGAQLAGHGSGAIRKLDDGLLVYGDPSRAETNPSANQTHTIRTPRGGQFKIELADGTTAWLNADSYIRFPLEFNSNERLVEVSGEVFFDVEKQADKPFVVRCDGQTIHVLGTSFVVTSYPDEKEQQTALLEGKVRVSIEAQNYQLSPGQRTVFDKHQKQVRKEPFDPEEAIAWKAGYFLFNAEPVESVMRKIARWYDIEVSYQGNMHDKQFSGSMSRFDQIQDVLNLLALTGTVNFKIDGRRVIVME